MKIASLSFVLLALGAVVEGATTTTKKSTTKSTKTTTKSTTKSTKLATTLATSVVTTTSSSVVVVIPTTTASATSAVGPVGTGIFAEPCPFGYGSLNGGTTGGAGGPVIQVSTLDALIVAVASNTSKIVVISGEIKGAAVVYIGSNTSVFGKPGASLIGIGLRILERRNVIIRNLKIGQCIAPCDSIGVQGQATENIWIDHVELFADQDHDKNYYDGLLDITHAVDYVTASNIWFHNHWKGAIVGHSDTNCPEDSGHLLVTFAYNHWDTIFSRGPMVRCGKVHIFNSYYNNLGDGIRTRETAQVLVENNVFELTNTPLIAKNGFAVERGNDFGIGQNDAPLGTFTQAPYTYNLIPTVQVKAYAIANAGAKLTGI